MQQAQHANAHIQGVKRGSILNNCSYFHILSNFSLDAMHDLLEGVVQYEVLLVLSHFVFQREPPLISFIDLNKEIES